MKHPQVAFSLKAFRRPSRNLIVLCSRKQAVCPIRIIRVETSRKEATIIRITRDSTKIIIIGPMRQTILLPSTKMKKSQNGTNLIQRSRPVASLAVRLPRKNSSETKLLNSVRDGEVTARM